MKIDEENKVFTVYSDNNNSENNFNSFVFDSEIFDTKSLIINKVYNQMEISDNVTLEKIYDGTQISIIINSEGIKYSTRSTYDAINKYDSEMTIKEQFINICSNKGFDIKKMQELTYNNFSLVLNFVFRTKISPFPVEDEDLVLLNGYKISNNSFSETLQSYGEYSANNFEKEEDKAKMMQKLNEFMKDYITPLDTLSILQLINSLHDNNTSITLKDEYQFNPSEDIQEQILNSQMT